MQLLRLSAHHAEALLALRIALDSDSPGPLGRLAERKTATSKETVDELLRSESAYTVGAFDNGRLVGVASVQPTPSNDAWHGVFGVGVERRARGAGIGRRLVEACRQHSEELHAELLLLEVNRPNPDAEHLYFSLGFEEWSEPAPSYSYAGTQYAVVHLRMRLRGA